MSPIRRVYTDGRHWPKDTDPAFVGYSIGKWLDTANDGTYDTLEIETRDLKGSAPDRQQPAYRSPPTATPS